MYVTPWNLKKLSKYGFYPLLMLHSMNSLRRMCKKQNATHFQHYLRNSKWCNSSQNKNTNYELRGYVRMLCTDEMRMISLLIEVVSTPCTSTSKELFLATQQMWHNSRFASQLIWHRKMLFEHYDLYSYYPNDLNHLVYTIKAVAASQSIFRNWTLLQPLTSSTWR